jgi:hypothetical protein
MSDKLYSEAPTRTLLLISDTGYTNTDLMLWLQYFQNNVKATETDPVQLRSNHFLQRESRNVDKHTSPWIIQDATSGVWLFWSPENGLHPSM